MYNDLINKFPNQFNETDKERLLSISADILKLDKERAKIITAARQAAHPFIPYYKDMGQYDYKTDMCDFCHSSVRNIDGICVDKIV